MKHRPLKKVKKSPKVLLYGVLLFISICVAFYWGLWDEKYNKILPLLHDSCYKASYILILILFPMYLLSAFVEPGNLKKNFDFIWLVD
jgi:hypothetical protein